MFLFLYLKFKILKKKILSLNVFFLHWNFSIIDYNDIKTYKIEHFIRPLKVNKNY